ncbi:MAG: zinc ribbon domain-containing protein [Haloferacaceae archaeon]
MSKITFRADDDLVRRLEEFDASKSEVMREALRSYLDGAASDAGSVDDALAERVDRLIDARLDTRLSRDDRDINVNITLDGVTPSDSTTTASSSASGSAVDPGRETRVGARETDVDASKTPIPEGSDTDENGDGDAQTRRKTCAQCGENMGADHVYCPNCGEKAAHRIFCECGDELRSDWAFCPGCGRRTPAADVLDRP